MLIPTGYGKNGSNSGLSSLAKQPLAGWSLQRSLGEDAWNPGFSGLGDQGVKPNEQTRYAPPAVELENSPELGYRRIEHAQAAAARQQPGISVRLTAPVKFFKKLTELWELDEEVSARLLGFEDKKHALHLLSGARNLSTRDEKDRVKYLFRIHEVLYSLFQDVDVECDWLRERRPEMENQSPIDLLSEGSMANMLLVKQFVERMAGR